MTTSEAFITGADFTDAGITGADFTGENLTDADFGARTFTDCNFTGADFGGNDIGDATFTRCNFTGANMTSVIARDGRFTDCNFTRANMADANFTGAHFGGNTTADGANFTGATLDQAAANCGAPNHWADFTDANFTYADMAGFRAYGIDFTRANFTGANMQEATIVGIITRADFTDADVLDANFAGATGTDFIVNGVAIFAAEELAGLAHQYAASVTDANTDSRRFTCPDCGDRYWEDDGCWDEVTEEDCCHYCYRDREDSRPCDCGDCPECWESSENGRLHAYSYAPDYRYIRGESEESATTFLGVEVEIHHARPDAIAELTEDRTDGLLYCKEDSSLGAGGVEVVSHPITLAGWRERLAPGGELHAVWQSVRKSGASGWSRDHHGTHVHVTREAFPSRVSIAIAIELVRQHREHWERLAGRGSTSYTRTDFGGADGYAILTGERPADRYHAINITNMHTVEFRMFRTSTRPECILGAIELVHALTTYAASGPPEVVLAGDSWENFRAHVAANYPAAADMITRRLGTN